MAVVPVAPIFPAGMNGLERRYAEALQARKERGEIASWWFEAMTLVLADGVRYTPDFLVQLPTGELELHETKGFMREAARVRLRVCARMYPFRVWLVEQKGGKRAAFTFTEVSR